jgi:hypothetical protein
MRSNFDRREADFTPRVRDTDNDDPRRPAAGIQNGSNPMTFSDSPEQVAGRRIELGAIGIKADRPSITVQRKS